MDIWIYAAKSRRKMASMMHVHWLINPGTPSIHAHLLIWNNISKNDSRKYETCARIKMENSLFDIKMDTYGTEVFFDIVIMILHLHQKKREKWDAPKHHRKHAGSSMMTFRRDCRTLVAAWMQRKKWRKSPTVDKLKHQTETEIRDKQGDRFTSTRVFAVQRG